LEKGRAVLTFNAASFLFPYRRKLCYCNFVIQNTHTLGECYA
jgi:hypothetical protein